MPEMFAFIRLQGKQAIEAVFDPTLNSTLLAWDVLVPNVIDAFWTACKAPLPSPDPAFLRKLQWREITPRPRDRTEAMAVFYSIIDQHIRRLQKLLAKHEEIEEAMPADRADLAAFDTSPAIDRHRKYQSTRIRELLRTLDMLRKIRNAETEKRNPRGGVADGS